MKPLVYKKASRKRTEAKPVRIKLHITKGDVVQVISGDEKGKRGTVLRVFPKTGRVVVDGLNMPASPQGEQTHMQERLGPVNRRFELTTEDDAKTRIRAEGCRWHHERISVSRRHDPRNR